MTKNKLTKRQLKLLEHPPKCAASDCSNSTKLSKKKAEWLKYCSQTCAGRWNSLLSREKTKEVCMKRYGVENPLQDSQIFQKARNTMMTRYGVEFSGQSLELLQKKNNTMIERYGVVHAFQNETIKDKRDNTMLERYGVVHALHYPEFLKQARESSEETELLLYGTKGWRLSHLSDEQYNLLYDTDKLNELIKTHSISSIANLLGVSISYVYHIFQLNNIPIPYKTISAFHYSVLEFIKSIKSDVKIISNDRSILHPMEIDILLPEYNLALECNGSYWHSEDKGKMQYYHLIKSKECANQNIKLLHIWQHEWLNSSNILKSIIREELNKINYINSNLLTIALVSKNDEELFLKASHLDGYEPSNIAIGLYQDTELLALISFNSDYFERNDWKILRYATKLNTNIINGYGKILNHFIKTIIPNSIIMFTQKYITDGKILIDLGFEWLHSLEPSKFYVKHSIKNRTDFYTKISQPKIINSTIYSIWDCGLDVWKWIKT